MLVLFVFGCIVAIGVFLRVLRRRGGVGFVHPSSGGGGGGERVLWVGIKALQDSDEAKGVKRTYVLYTLPYDLGGPSINSRTENNLQETRRNELLALVRKQFGIVLSQPIECVFLRPSVMKLLDAKVYPRLTLLLQSVCGGLALWWECAVTNSCTSIVIESVGIPFSYPLFRLLSGATVAAYIHYPVISTDMIRRVQGRRESYNNNGTVANSRVLTELKLLYYRCFAWSYRLVGKAVTLAMTNSTWTNNHIKTLWGIEPTLVYPPCNVKDFNERSVARDGRPRDHSIVSIGQFRPEKNHSLQLQAFALALPKLPSDAKLYLVGGARNDEDRARVDRLRKECVDLHIADRVEFCVSCSFERIAELLSVGLCGLHTMLDEHFGIVVVEYLAAGCVPLAHNSGGVAVDILPSRDIGFLATTREEFAAGMIDMFDLHDTRFEMYDKMQRRGAAQAQLFSDGQFSQKYVLALSAIL